jgi:hypothetical protein
MKEGRLEPAAHRPSPFASWRVANLDARHRKPEEVEDAWLRPLTPI